MSCLRTPGNAVFRSPRRWICAFILAVTWTSSSFAQTHPAWTFDASIYEVNVRQYSSAGTFNAFGSHLDRLHDLGVKILWFMPIHPIGSQNRLGSLGSYYSVKDYYGVNPEFGTLADFKTLVDSVHARGMYVMMDWVANHTSWDNGLTLSHPEWYAKNQSGGFIPPPGTNWSDVIQLDHSQNGLRAYMIDALRYWVTEAGVDGFRFDAASRVPVDYWEAIAESLTITRPDILLLAEDQGTQYYPAGLHMTFAWNFYGFGAGLLKNIVNNAANAHTIASYFANETSTYPGGNLRLYFTSNHDENSWSGTDAELFGNAADAFLVLSMTARSVPLIYSGQEAGLNHRLKFFDKDQIVWQAHPRESVIREILSLKRRNGALWNGTAGDEPNRITTSLEAVIYAFEREKNGANVCAIFNFSPLQRTFTFTGAGIAGTYHDVLTDTVFAIARYDTMTLPAWGFRVLEGIASSGERGKAEIRSEELQLHPNFPNPFNGTTAIRWTIPSARHVRVTIADILGRQIEVLLDEERPAGTNTVLWVPRAIASGMYVCRLTASGVARTRLILFAK